jgi:RNA polymerase sigma factor (sigma-70 family)
MVNSSLPESGRKSDWNLTQSVFRKLLDWLDAGTDSGGHRYLEIRQRLVLYFDRKNCHSPDELADETLNRVARRLDEEGGISIDTPVHYCYIVARFVLLEYFRSNQNKVLDDRYAAPPDTSAEEAENERRSECLEQCIKNLPTEDRDLIRSYYIGQQRTKIENRKTMAAKLGISINALIIRASRIRDKLEVCMEKCLMVKNERF